MWVKERMKQVIQSRRTGKLALKEVPEPKVRPGHLLVRTRASLISAGTERMVIDFAKKSLAGKAKARPDLVRKVIDKAKRDGLQATFQTVMARLDEPLPLGYSAAGDVVAVGAGLEGAFKPGQKIAVAGAGLANHAELNVVPASLAAPVPDGVSDEDACFGTLGAIALHAVRNVEPKLGDVVAVIGLGLVGQLASQFLALSGARVIALDYDGDRLALARKLGAEASHDLGSGPPEAAIAALTGGRGCDGVIIAAATSSNEPFLTAVAIARDRARVALVGLTGTEFPYAEFMKKELTIVVSRSYGPGRYDAEFERRNVKYPEGWVRWTETENLAETLRLIGAVDRSRLDVGSLITHRLPFEEAETAYAMIAERSEPHLGVVLTYSDGDAEGRETVRVSFPRTADDGIRGCVLGVIGAGSFAKAVLLPELKRLDQVTLHTLATTRSETAEHGQKSFGFLNAATDVDAVLESNEINAVVIATRHDSHADLTARAVAAGKAVWVEKPLSLDWNGLNRVIDARNGAAAESGIFFQVGFNRRFAPMAEKIRDDLSARSGRKVISIRVNAGAIAGDHWVHQAEEGGGRILGEVCHFVDFARFLTGQPIHAVQAEAALTPGNACDDVSISIGFSDGSLATILYTASGDSSAGKERYEVFCQGRNWILEDFRRLNAEGNGPSVSEKKVQDKGFRNAIKAFVDTVTTGGAAPVDEAELIETSATTLAVVDSLRHGQRIVIDGSV